MTAPAPTRRSLPRLVGALDRSTWVFAAVLAVAVPAIFRAGDHQWFFLDEWDFLAARDLSPASLVRPHNEHLVAIPVVVYRVIWRLVGLHHYWPYQVPVVAAHLAVAVLLRMVMRGIGVDRWLATAAATAFVFFGAGYENIIWAFQVTFTGSLAFGLAHVLLVDHDGPVGRRDLAGAVCGAAALLCSGIGVMMVGAVGVTALLRRGWRVAALHVVPLAALFLTWFLVQRPPSAARGDSEAVRELFVNTFVETASSFFGHGVLALSAVAVSAAGWVLIIRREGRAALVRYAAPLGLAAGAVGCAASVAVGRALLSSSPSSRYLHIVAALLLPLVAVGFSAVADRWRVAVVGLVVLVLLGIPGNLGRFDDGKTFGRGSPDLVLALAAGSVEPTAPRGIRPLGLLGEAVTTGWLADGVRSGRIPHETHVAPATSAAVALRLAFDQPGDLQPADLGEAGPGCIDAAPPGPIRVEAGQVLRVEASQADLVEVLAGGRSPVVQFTATHGSDAADGPVLLEAVRPVEVAFAGPPAPGRVAVCG